MRVDGRGDGDGPSVADVVGHGTTGIRTVVTISGDCSGDASAIDVALTLALLAAFASIAFVKAAGGYDDEPS